MKLKTLRELRDKAPFKPFDIHLSDGQALTVLTADHLFFVPESDEIIVGLAAGGFRIVDAVQIVSAGRGRAKARSH